MKFEFRFEVAPGTARRVAAVGVTLLLVGAGVAAYASQISFSSGQTLTAADLNNNFNELCARTVVTRNGKSVTVNGAFCAATSQSYDGIQVGGYSGAKTKCEAACAATTAHMCTPEEILRSAQLGAAMPTSWFSSAHYDAFASAKPRQRYGRLRRLDGRHHGQRRQRQARTDVG